MHWLRMWGQWAAGFTSQRQLSKCPLEALQFNITFCGLWGLNHPELELRCHHTAWVTKSIAQVINTEFDLKSTIHPKWSIGGEIKLLHSSANFKCWASLPKSFPHTLQISKSWGEGCAAVTATCLCWDLSVHWYHWIVSILSNSRKRHQDCSIPWVELTSQTALLY